jgi:predicted dehydrogenase
MEACFGAHVPFDPNHRMYNPSLGGGALLDLGVYPITLAHLLFGLNGCEVVSSVERAETGVDETSTIHLTYPDGLMARLFCSASKETPHTAFFTGANGTAVLEDFFHPAKLDIRPDRGAPTVIASSYPHMGYNFQIDEVHRALFAEATQSELMPLAHSHDVLSLIDRVLGSS